MKARIVSLIFILLLQSCVFVDKMAGYIPTEVGATDLETNIYRSPYSESDTITIKADTGLTLRVNVPYESTGNVSYGPFIFPVIPSFDDAQVNNETSINLHIRTNRKYFSKDFNDISITYADSSEIPHTLTETDRYKCRSNEELAIKEKEKGNIPLNIEEENTNYPECMHYYYKIDFTNSEAKNNAIINLGSIEYDGQTLSLPMLHYIYDTEIEFYTAP